MSDANAPPKGSETLVPSPAHDTSRMKRPRVPTPKSATAPVSSPESVGGAVVPSPQATGSGLSMHSSAEAWHSPSNLYPRISLDGAEPPRKGPRLESRPSLLAGEKLELRTRAPHPSIVQRRAQKAMHKVPNLHLTPTNDRLHLADPHFMEPTVRSAPPQQRQFGGDARLPPPSFLLRASEREPGVESEVDMRKVPPSASLSSQQEMQGYLPTPGGTPRFFLPHQNVLPSPAYHTTRMEPYSFRSTRDRLPVPNEQTGVSRPPDTPAFPHHDGEPMSAPPRSPGPNKAHFLSLFSDFFDALSDSRTLKATLEHQIRASNTLLQTLQRSTEVFEEAVEQRVQQENKTWEARFSQLDARLKQLESQNNET